VLVPFNHVARLIENANHSRPGWVEAETLFIYDYQKNGAAEITVELFRFKASAATVGDLIDRLAALS
jgi:hypothetical protein